MISYTLINWIWWNTCLQLPDFDPNFSIMTCWELFWWTTISSSCNTCFLSLLFGSSSWRESSSKDISNVCCEETSSGTSFFEVEASSSPTQTISTGWLTVWAPASSLFSLTSNPPSWLTEKFFPHLFLLWAPSLHLATNFHLLTNQLPIDTRLSGWYHGFLTIVDTFSFHLLLLDNRLFVLLDVSFITLFDMGCHPLPCPRLLPSSRTWWWTFFLWCFPESGRPPPSRRGALFSRCHNRASLYLWNGFNYNFSFFQLLYLPFGTWRISESLKPLGW